MSTRTPASSAPTHLANATPATAAASVNASSAPPGSAAPAVPDAVLSPTALRRLVMGYLVHQSYAKTAVAFARAGVQQDASSPTASGAAGDVAAERSPPQTSAAHERPRHPLATAHAPSEGPSAVPDPALRAEIDVAASAVQGTDLSPEEMTALLYRRQIKNLIHQGHIRAAMDNINANFPGVLISSLTNGGLDPVPSAGPSTKSLSGKASLPSYPTSLDPAHLELNLLIQQFIETVRSASSVPPDAPAPAPASTGNGAGNGTTSPVDPTGAISPSALHPTHPLASVLRSSGSRAGSRAGSPAPESVASSESTLSLTPSGHVAAGSGGRGANLSGPESAAARARNNVYDDALGFIQHVHASCHRLPDVRAKARYLKEIENVSVLLAYPDLKNSPAQGYLDHRRRIALAEQVNAAILLRTGHASQPLLESAARQTAFLFSQLAKDHVLIPADTPFPPSPLHHDSLLASSDSTQTDPWWTQVSGVPYTLEPSSSTRTILSGWGTGARVSGGWSMERFLDGGKSPLKRL